DVASYARDPDGRSGQPGEERVDVVVAHLLGGLVAGVAGSGPRVRRADRKIVLRGVDRDARGQAISVVLAAAQDDVLDDLLVERDRALDLPPGVLEIRLILHAQRRVIAEVVAPVPDELTVVDMKEREVLRLVTAVGHDPHGDAPDGAGG